MSELNDRRRVVPVPQSSPTTFSMSGVVGSPTGGSQLEARFDLSGPRPTTAAFPPAPTTMRLSPSPGPLSTSKPSSDVFGTGGGGERLGAVASPPTVIQVAPGAAEGRGGRRARGHTSAGYRDARMSWYSTRLSFFFLFILFLFAVGNVAALVYYYKHGTFSPSGRSAGTGGVWLTQTQTPTPLPPPPPPQSMRDSPQSRQPGLLIDGGNNALEQETARRVHRGRRVLLDVFQHDLGPLLVRQGILSGPPTSEIQRPALSSVAWLPPLPFLTPLLNLTVHVRASSRGGGVNQQGAQPAMPALWLPSASTFSEGFSELFDSVTDAEAHFYRLMDGSSSASSSATDMHSRASGVEDTDRRDEPHHASAARVVPVVAQHGKHFQDVLTYAHRGLRFADEAVEGHAADTARVSGDALSWPAGALPNWASPAVADAMTHLLEIEEDVERALYAPRNAPLPERPGTSTLAALADHVLRGALPAAFLPVHWLSHQLAPSEAAEVLTLLQPSHGDIVAAADVDGHHSGGGDGNTSAQRESLRIALRRAGITARRGHHTARAPVASATYSDAQRDRVHRRTLLRLAKEVAYCDPSEGAFHPLTDQACTRYLADHRQWLAMKPMTSTYASGRTIKFMLSFRHGNVSAVVKIPQTGFAVEAMSEVAAYHLDRLLGFRRVPPTVLVEMPLSYLRASAASLDNAFYARWLEAYVLRSPATARARHVCRHASTHAHLAQNGFASVSSPRVDSASAECIWVSVQLWLSDVDPVESTLFAGLATDETFFVPKRLKQIPTPRDTTASSSPWTFMDVDGAGGTTEEEDDDEVVHDRAPDAVRATRWPPPPAPHWLTSLTAGTTSQAAAAARLFYPMRRYVEAASTAVVADGAGPPTDHSGGARHLVLPRAAMRGVESSAPRTRAQLQQAALRALMWKERHDQALFDVIIDNQDRWEGHNLFVLAGCGGAEEGRNLAAGTEMLSTCVAGRRRARHRRAAVTEGGSTSPPPAMEWNDTARAAFTLEDVAHVRPARVRVPRLVYLDQGSGFFQKSLPRDSPFHVLAFATADAPSAAPGRAVRRSDKDQPTDPSEVLFCQNLYHPTLQRLESLTQQAVWLHRHERLLASLMDRDDAAGGGSSSSLVSASLVRAYLAWRHALLRPGNDETDVDEEAASDAASADYVDALHDTRELTWLTARHLDGELASLDAGEVGQALYALLRWRLPSGLGEVLPHHLIEAACRRVWSVLANRQRCAARYGETNIYL